MTQPGIPNELALSTACFGPRLRSIEDQVFSAAAMGFRRLELGLSADPPDLRGWDDAARETGIRLDSLVVGALKPSNGAELVGAKLGSLDAECREMALASARRHVRLAQQLGAPVVIVRGCAVEDAKLERTSQALLERHASATPDDREPLQEEVRAFVHKVQKKGHKQVEHLCRALHTLHAEFPETRFAVEPGSKLTDLIGFEAMEWVLDDLSSLGVGYWHDTGRIDHRSRLGLPGQGAWLDAFAGRTLGAHLSDATAEEDGLPPSQGEVDFRLVAEYLPSESTRVVDVHPTHGRAEVLASVQYLVSLGF